MVEPIYYRPTVSLWDVSVHAYPYPNRLNSIENFGVAVVLRSENTTFQEGDHIYGILRVYKSVIKHDG